MRKDLFGVQETSPYDVLNKYDYLLVDINNLAYRAYYATKLTNSAGESTSIFHIPLKTLYNMIQTMQPKGVVLCWDSILGYWRKLVYPEYKANREKKGEDVYKIFADLYWLCDYLGFQQVMSEGYEADDWMAYLTAKNESCAVYSGDRDLFQLVDDSRKNCVIYPDKEKIIIEVDEAKAEELFIEPRLVSSYKAIAGDTSDNIKGVPGVGEKRVRLVLEHVNLSDWLSEESGTISPIWFDSAPVKAIEKITSCEATARKCFQITDLKHDHSPKDFSIFNKIQPKNRIDDFEEFLVGNGLSELLDISENFKVILSRMEPLFVGKP